MNRRIEQSVIGPRGSRRSKAVPNYDLSVLERELCPKGCGEHIALNGGARASHLRACGRDNLHMVAWTPEELTLP